MYSLFLGVFHSGASEQMGTTEDSISHSPFMRSDMSPVLTLPESTIETVALQRFSILRAYPAHHLLSCASFDLSNSP